MTVVRTAGFGSPATSGNQSWCLQPQVGSNRDPTVLCPSHAEEAAKSGHLEKSLRQFEEKEAAAQVGDLSTESCHLWSGVGLIALLSGCRAFVECEGKERFRAHSEEPAMTLEDLRR